MHVSMAVAVPVSSGMARLLPNHAGSSVCAYFARLPTLPACLLCPLCLQVCMVLRYVADEITLYGDDIAVSQRVPGPPQAVVYEV